MNVLSSFSLFLKEHNFSDFNIQRIIPQNDKNKILNPDTFSPAQHHVDRPTQNLGVWRGVESWLQREGVFSIGRHEFLYSRGDVAASSFCLVALGLIVFFISKGKI